MLLCARPSCQNSDAAAVGITTRGADDIVAARSATHVVQIFLPFLLASRFTSPRLAWTRRRRRRRDASVVPSLHSVFARRRQLYFSCNAFSKFRCVRRAVFLVKWLSSSLGPEIIAAAQRKPSSSPFASSDVQQSVAPIYRQFGNGFSCGFSLPLHSCRNGTPWLKLHAGVTSMDLCSIII